MLYSIDLTLLIFILLFLIYGISFCYSPRLKYPQLDTNLYFFFFCILSNGVYMYITASPVEISLYHGLLIKNQSTNILSTALLFTTLITGFCMRYYNKKLAIYAFEYLFLILFLGYVSTLLIVSNHIVCTAILMELYGVLLIVLAVVNKRSRQSSESGTKYYILSSFASIMLLLGVAIMYVTTSLTYYPDLATFLNLLFSSSTTLEDKWGVYVAISFIVVGFLFKLYSSPFHFWVSDIYEGSANSAVIYFSTSSYFIYIYVFLKLYLSAFLDAISFFQPFFMAIAILTMLSGAIGGLMQRTLKRVIAYSSVTATGYFLLILSCNNFYGLVSFFVFLITYAIALFAVFVFISQPVLHGKSFISFFDDLENYYKINKVISFMLSAFFFSLGGIPPFIGFIGKFEMLGSLFFNGYFAAFLAFLIISTISFLYYARIVKALYTKDINTFLYIENFSFFNSVVIVFCFLFLLIGFFYSGSLHLFAQLLVFNLVSV